MPTFKDKCKATFHNLINTWKSWPTRTRKIITAASAVVIVGALIGGIVWWHSPSQEARRDNTAQNRLLKHSQYHNAPNGKHFRYQVAGGVPALSDLAKERRQNPHPYLRGQVSIPQYGVDVPIFEGTALSTLAWGGGTAKPYQQMGKGNYAIEAHNFSKIWDADETAPNWFFSNFEKKVAPEGDVEMSNINIQPGTAVFTLDKHYVYRWTVTKQMLKDIRDEYAGEVLSDKAVKEYSSHGNTPLLTMATCYEQWGILHPDQRIVLIAQLDSKMPRSKFTHMDEVFKDV